MPSATRRPRDVPAALRHFLLAVFLLGALGTAGELLLVEHYEDPWQYAPLVLIGTSLVLLAVHAAWPRRATVFAFRGLMALFAVASVAGLMLHYRANVEFVAETYPELIGWPLFWESVRGVSPPSLAPGAMLALALAGLGFTYRHPVLPHHPSSGDGS